MPVDSSEKAFPRTSSNVYSFDLGVWHVYKLRGKPLLSSSYTRLRAVSVTVPYFLRMVFEIVHFEPVLTVVYLLAQVWSSISVAISVYLASRLFYAVERSSNEASMETIWLLVAHLLWLSLMAMVNLIVERTIPALERRINSRYEALSMEVRFSQSSNISRAQQDRLSSISWNTFSGNVMFLRQLVAMISQVLVLIQTAMDIDDPLFATLALIIPTRQILLNAGTRRLYDTPYFVAAQNTAYCRKAAMKMMSNTEFRADVFGAGVDSFIVKEYKKASEQCQDISDADAAHQYTAQSSLSGALIWALASDFLHDLPMAYCAFCTFYQRRVSLSSVVLLHQHSLALDSNLGNLSAMFETFEENCRQLKVAYDAAAESQANADEHETSYTDAKSATPQRGRRIQVKNVDFRYPGATALALKNINLTIEPGQLVAVVGKNGSGKSTLMNILTSMLEPTSGEILINCQPSRPLRERTAILSQQPRAFPLSVSENIGIGMAEEIHNAEMVEAAAKKGGVDLSKFDDGRALMLNPSPPLAPCVVLNSAMDESEKELFDEWLKHMDRPVSGGELQRIGVARTFMRLNARDSTGDGPLVDFVVLDEPISATDPQAEKLIIDNFVCERQGRTMMVVTHKFGHLTKAADVIVCMKDGEVCELGTHAELLALQGEYASLYEVQAEAYADV